MIGFAAETENLQDNSIKKLSKKGCDWILGNNVSDNNVFNQETNKIFFVSRQYTEKWGLMSEKEVAQKLCEKITIHLNH